MGVITILTTSHYLIVENALTGRKYYFWDDYWKDYNDLDLGIIREAETSLWFIVLVSFTDFL